MNYGDFKRYTSTESAQRHVNVMISHGHSTDNAYMEIRNKLTIFVSVMKSGPRENLVCFVSISSLNYE